MNSNNNVDQAAALIMCSVAAAKRFGIPEDRWIYPWAGTDAHDHYFVSNRDNLHSSPAIRFAGARCLELAGVTAKSLDHVDLYSCFPVAVQVAAAELGLDERRPLTVTGGLTFGGGPLNNYVMHSIARMAEVLRGDRNARGLVTANGGYLTKHAFGVYSSQPPTRAFRHEDLQAKVDETPQRDVAMAHRGAGRRRKLHGDVRRRRSDDRARCLSSPRRSACVGQLQRCGRARRHDARGVLRPPRATRRRRIDFIRVAWLINELRSLINLVD